MSRFMLVSLFVAMGCAPEVAPGDGAPSLLDAISVTADGALAPSSLSFVASGGLSAADETAEVKVALAQLALRLDVEGGGAQLRFVDLPIGDLTISPAALPPSGLHLVDLRIGIETAAPLVVTAKSIDDLWLASTMGLKLTWSLALPDGSTYALGPVRLSGIDVGVRIHRDASAYVMSLRASCDETCWSLPKLLAVRDLQIELEAPVTVTPIDRGPVSLPPLGTGPKTIVD